MGSVVRQASRRSSGAGHKDAVEMGDAGVPQRAAIFYLVVSSSPLDLNSGPASYWYNVLMGNWFSSPQQLATNSPSWQRGGLFITSGCPQHGQSPDQLDAW